MTGLKSRECVVCHEVHLVRSDGRMSIHQNVRGERCEEPHASTSVEGAREASYAAKRLGSVPRRRIDGEEPSELDEAFGVASDKLHRRDDRRRGRPTAVSTSRVGLGS